ncbi:MAG: hypothetical protein WD228_03845 [Mycobacterium sp.]
MDRDRSGRGSGGRADRTHRRALRRGQLAAGTTRRTGPWLIVPAWLLGRLRGQRQYRWVKRAHLLAYAAWPMATAHYVLAGTDALAPWSLAILVGGTAVMVGALLARAR